MKTQLNFRVKKAMSLLMFLSIVLYVNAQNYSVSFAGHGESTEVESVLVQNITQGTSITILAGQTLNLIGTSGVNNVKASNNGEIICFNDAQGNSYISFNVNQSGSTMINAYSLDGRKITGITNNLSEGDYRYRMSLPKGPAVIQVIGNGFNYTSKLLNLYNGHNGVQIVSEGTEMRHQSFASRVKATNVPMEYTEGDRLVFRGESDQMATIVADVITADKTIDFNFVACEDYSGNHYATITIGDQVWMSENLKTRHYADGYQIQLLTSQEEYMSYPLNLRQTFHYCRYFQDDASKLDEYGLAYKYHTIQYGDLAPEGWHVPTNAEWGVLKSNLSANESERINSIRKTDGGWDIAGANNSSGFSAVATGSFWDGTAINSGEWAIWLANELFNDDPNNCWFFYVGRHSNSTNPAIVCEELPSSSLDLFGAIRCVRNK